MSQPYFVHRQSIVRQIWGKSDTILLIFAGAAAEFALNKAVDWLYFTGKLPKDPLGRLFSTVAYARTIVFAKKSDAFQAIDAINSIHANVEKARGSRIPDWAYRDVLFMLIDYSIRSFELLERDLTLAEKEEVFDVFYRFGTRMGIDGLPNSFKEWEIMREEHLRGNLKYSLYTGELYKQYRKHLGYGRYFILKTVQGLIVPSYVRQLLAFRRHGYLKLILLFYRLSRRVNLDRIAKKILLPQRYTAQINALDHPHV